MTIILKFQVHENYDGCSSEVYDPAFYLPILSHVSGPESPLKTFAFVRSGALALTLVALASQVEDVRTMAYSILSCFVDHLYTSKYVSCIQFLLIQKPIPL